jgi:hydrogenase maturation protein HypF
MGVDAAKPPVRSRIRVEGIVQGVGFRPFVHALAAEHRLAGFVGNDAAGVFIEAEGDPAAVGALVDAVRTRPPALALVERVSVASLPPTGEPGFQIVTSVAAGARSALVSPDTATCADCLRELLDPADRRHRYAFVNCTNCGPRFTIVRDVPYDRPLTTMAGFAMCAACAREYHDPADRRFHAQPTCCPACGPSLRLVTSAGAPVAGDPVQAAAALLDRGAVVAVKGLGGYHLAADATCEPAVAALRARKHREDKPFAVLVPDLATAAHVCEVDPVAEGVLAGRRRPIVLLPRRPAGDGAGTAPEIAHSVAPGNRVLGLMLPYTPLHHLLAAELGRPFVLTSGNVSDEPIAYHDPDATERLAGIADAFLTHDRPIHVRADDSVVRIVQGGELPLRRSRGYAPEPLTLPWTVPRPVLACGAELKSTFCLATGDRAFVSHHIGDLENYETLRSFTDGIGHFQRLFDITPLLVAHDLHPDYLSTKYAQDLAGMDRGEVELVGVQHHHAHVAACLADNGEAGPVVGVAFDGLGYGVDGTLWGGEVLVADLVGFERVGWLEPVALPGGAAAIREPWRMAAAYLHAAYGDEPPAGLDVVARNRPRWRAVVTLASGGVRSPLTSSAGRLFDAVAALLGVRDVVRYEGQAAIELEQLADRATRDGYPVALDGGAPLVLRGTDLIRAVVDDLRRGVDPAVIAARFHNGLAALVVATAGRVAASAGLGTVALSGGVFQNMLLLEAVAAGLRREGLKVLVHRRVPPNDGGISLGQAAVAAARDRQGTA